jgi:Domain of unknown function (DUF4234)
MGKPRELNLLDPEWRTVMQPINVNVNVDSGSRRMSALALGNERNPALIVLLTVLTAGIYGFFHIYSMFEETKRFVAIKNPTISVTSGGAAVGFMFIPLFNIVWNIMIMFKFPGLISKLYEASGRNSPGWAWFGLVNLVPVVGWFTVLIVTQVKVNEFWREQRSLLANEFQSERERPVTAQAA